MAITDGAFMCHMTVYSEATVQKLKRHMSSFHATSINPAMWNLS